MTTPKQDLGEIFGKAADNYSDDGIRITVDKIDGDQLSRLADFRLRHGIKDMAIMRSGAGLTIRVALPVSEKVNG